jgi:glycosyltransferase involved in cell wall biosynthesis
LRKILAKIVVKNAAYLLPVSKELLEGLKFNHLLKTKYKVIENVVDKCFYESYPVKPKEKKQIVNVTCFLENAKNLFGLLRAIKVISDQRNDFELILVGNGVDFEKTYDYYKTLNFPEGIVHFAGERTSKEVAEIMQNGDFVVQFSNYESAGVVVEEALVSGKPVISTKVGIAPDYINNSNGLLVDVRDQKQLAEAINYLLDNINQYNNDEIRKSNAEFFSYEYIGRKFHSIYKEILQK